MSDRLNANATEAETQAFREACAAMGFEPPHVLRWLATAFVTHVGAGKKFVFPIEFKDSNTG